MLTTALYYQVTTSQATNPSAIAVSIVYIVHIAQYMTNYANAELVALEVHTHVENSSERLWSEIPHVIKQRLSRAKGES